MQFYCSEQMQNRELNTCKHDIYSFLHIRLPTNTEPILPSRFSDRSNEIQVKFHLRPALLANYY